MTLNLEIYIVSLIINWVWFDINMLLRKSTFVLLEKKMAAESIN